MSIILGIDASIYQGSNGMSLERFNDLSRSGVRFGVFRATIGTQHDPSFDRNVARAARQGWWGIGGYHFLVPNISPKAQALAFAKAIWDLPGWLDVEANGLSAKDVREFHAAFREARPRGFLGIYTSEYKWRSLTRNMDGASLFDGLWNAIYTEKGTDSASDLPSTPPKANYGGWRGFPDLWQYGAFHPRKGGALDGNAFYGTQVDLENLFARRQRPPLEERPAYIAGYNQTVQETIATLADGPAPSGKPVFEKGVAAARQDIIEAIKALPVA